MSSGGAERDRTADPLLAKQVLSQLSYSPIVTGELRARLVGLGRFELPTSPLSGVRSNQLSYRPKARVPSWPAPPPGISITAHPAVPNHFQILIQSFKKGFEDKVEHAGKLRFP